jgi:hypothetical protein
MIERSYDRQKLFEATKELRWMNSPEVLDKWWSLPNNVMLVDGDDVGLATYEYPGVYTCHLYFKSKGRKAIKQGQAMLQHLFDNYDVTAVRGLIKKQFKAARWAARQMGWQSLGFVKFPNGEDELFYGTKEHFKAKNKDTG